MASTLPPAQEREARIALAMLPVGGAFLVGSALALVAVAALAIDLLVRGVLGWTLVWCGLAAAVAVWNARAGIEMMSAFDWRPLPLALALSAAVLGGWFALP